MADYEEGNGAPIEEDRRFEDEDYNPQLEPKKAKAWLNLLRESEKAFEDYNDHCDKIDKLFANLSRLSANGRDKEFQMFWANVEVMRPSIYARPPQPVVVTRFKDRRPVYQAAAELLERANVSAFEIAKIDEVMKLIRDDVAILNRGVAWCRYESGSGRGRSSGAYYDHEKVCIDFKHRRDFLHSLSRCWYEVTWVAAASYLTRAEARKRFFQYSGKEYQDAEYEIDKDSEELGGGDNRERAKIWEIWDKTNRRVIWVAHGCENILDEDDAHLDLQDFFPCPQPAYGVTQRGSLVPVPDVMQYKDQLDELNLLTARIHALSDALEAKGFYPAGGAEIGDAVQAAISMKSSGRILVPISNWAAFGGSKEIIVWMPIVEIAQTITQCVQLREQIIQDIYQIMGLSDIMRGATDARETLGAQELKSQFGSTRIRDKQLALVRLARDLVCICSDIITDKFDDETIIQMTQTQLPTAAMQQQQAQQLMQQLGQQQQAMQMLPQTPQFQQMQQQNPDGVAQLTQQGQQLIQTGQATLKQIMAKPTFEQVMTVLRDMRARGFILDIETDSTILIDENTEKQRRMEVTGVMAQLLPQLTAMIAAEPATAEFAGEVFKFAIAPYRASRQLDGAIDSLVMLMQEKTQQPRGDDPTTATNKVTMQIEQMKNTTQQQKDQADAALKAKELQQKDEHAKLKIASNEKIKLAQMREKQQDAATQAQERQLDLMQSREEHRLKLAESENKMREGQMKLDLARQQSQLKANEMMQRENERRAMQQFKQQDMAARSNERQQMHQFKMQQPQRPQGMPR